MGRLVSELRVADMVGLQDVGSELTKGLDKSMRQRLFTRSVISAPRDMSHQPPFFFLQAGRPVAAADRSHHLPDEDPASVAYVMEDPRPWRCPADSRTRSLADS